MFRRLWLSRKKPCLGAHVSGGSGGGDLSHSENATGLWWDDMGTGDFWVSGNGVNLSESLKAGVETLCV